MISGFEFLQLFSLAPNLIDTESTEMVKRLSIYPMEYMNITDDVTYT